MNAMMNTDAAIQDTLPRSRPADAGPGGRLAAVQRSFASVISRAQSRPETAGMPRAEQAREAAEQLVAATFVQPLLAQLRGANGASAPFAPTSGEKQMQSLADAELAQRLVKATRFPIVDRLTKDLLSRGVEGARAGLAPAAPKPLPFDGRPGAAVPMRGREVR